MLFKKARHLSTDIQANNFTHSLFETGKCAYCYIEQPYIIGEKVSFVGYLWCCMIQRRCMRSPEVILEVRREQLAQLFSVPVGGLYPNGIDKTRNFDWLIVEYET